MKRLHFGASPIEHSPAARAFAYGGFFVATVAVIVYGQDPTLGLLCLGAALIAHRVSYFDRMKKRSFWGQAMLAGLVIAAMVYFFAASAFGLLGLPQATFAILLATITSFDLKSRRNLYSSLWISLVILYLAAVYAWDYLFGAFVVAWTLCLAGFWWSSHLKRLNAPLGGPALPMTTSAIAAGLVGVFIFIAVPQPSGAALPMVLSLPNLAGFRGDIESSALPLIDVGGGVAGGSSIDLHYRGRLGDAPVMYVRTGAPAYWRGQVFDTYRDGVWTASNRDYRQLPPYVPAHLLPPAPPNNLGTFTQVFRVTRPLPGVINAAYPMESLYAPVSALRQDAYGTFYTPDLLRPGQTYSVVSYLPNLSPQELRGDHHPDQVPQGNFGNMDSSGISQAAFDLALQVTHGATTEFDVVMALTTYLQHNYRYSLDIPRVPSGREPVDWFLFDVKTGYCEQFATAATLMLRSLGIPARLATGYATGDYNSLLNQSVVREHDAHAWVEAWFPEHGWVPVDPTPGVDPLAIARMPSHWAAGGLAQLVPHLTIGAPTAALGSLGALALIPAAIAAIAVLALLWAWLRRRPLRRARARVKPAPGESELLRLYERLQEKIGRRRAPPQTPLEYLSVTGEEPMQPLLEEVTHAVNQGAYAGRWPAPERVREMADRLS